MVGTYMKLLKNKNICIQKYSGEIVKQEKLMVGTYLIFQQYSAATIWIYHKTQHAQ